VRQSPTVESFTVPATDPNNKYSQVTVLLSAALNTEDS
jgi:hypothetical protein